MAVNETLIHHASDWIDWVDASGSSDHQPLITNPLQLQLDDAPRDLRLISHNGRTRLWRQQPDALHQVVEGRASEAQLAYPATASFAIAGEIRDQQRRFNPRRFALSAGNAAGHSVELFRSPLGSRIGAGGALRGNARFDANTPASWAVLSITVTPLVGPALSFRAQADHAGDFVLAMHRLPALAKDITPRVYDAELSAQALLAASDTDIADPDQFVAAEIGDTENDTLFATTIEFTVSPGAVSNLTSKGQPHLVLRIP